MACRFSQELFGRRPCTMMMDAAPLIVESTVTLHELSSLILEMEPYHLTAGFIVTDRGTYLGMGSGHDLLRAITQMRIAAARYANPLTRLPGNVPNHEHIDRLLQNGASFCICYFDLDYFKPYNDVYGFRKGDEVIKHTSKLLREIVQPEFDFVGHIGGDDFIALFRRPTGKRAASCCWKNLPRRLPPTTKRRISSAAAASLAKKEAKKTAGNALFLDRRDLPPCRYD